MIIIGLDLGEKEEIVFKFIVLVEGLREFWSSLLVIFGFFLEISFGVFWGKYLEFFSLGKNC